MSLYFERFSEVVPSSMAYNQFKGLLEFNFYNKLKETDTLTARKHTK